MRLLPKLEHECRAASEVCLGVNAKHTLRDSRHCVCMVSRVGKFAVEWS